MPRAVSNAAQPIWLDVAALALLLLILGAIYLPRLTTEPIVGEESRWATGAREMLSSGDWVVPRQQGMVFPERPPLNMWLMAIAGYVRGDVDAVAIRLPSVVAVLLTSLLIYGYSRALISRFAALTSAVAYATFGQVLQIGRLGESEAVFALLVGASLLLWHLAYLRGASPLVAWSLGFACAALAALAKGPQAPVYFVAITGTYLLLRRDWRYVINWQLAAGAMVFIGIIAVWQIPFYHATNWEAVAATWAGLAADRVHLAGLATHIVTYPLETFICLLPWSPILFAFAHRDMRKLVDDQGPIVSFVAVALVVAYPTVWLAAGAQARYFMPLYPLMAVLVGLAIDRASTDALGNYPRRAWHQFLLVSSLLIVALAVLANVSTSSALGACQPDWFRLALAVLAVAAVTVLATCYQTATPGRRIAALVVIAAFAGLTQAGLLMNLNLARWNNPVVDVAELKQLIGDRQPLVSLTPIDHRFAYFYGDPIAELAWPRDVDDLPANVEYFCFMRHPTDTAASREAGRGRTWTRTPGTLPFAWEEVATLCVERRLRNYPQRVLVLGRVVRPRLAVVTDATKPRATAIDLTASNNLRPTRR